MRIVRLLFPKTLAYYLFFFLVCLAFMILALWGYYHLTAIEKFFGAPVPFLDLHQRGNVLDWFFSLLWLHIAVSSLVVLAGVLDRKETKLHVFFWISLPILALFLSGEMVCSFTSTFFNILVQTDKNAKNPFFFSFIFLRFIYAFFILLAFWALFQFVRTRPMSRLLLIASTGICFLGFVFVFVFCSSFPRVPANTARVEQDSSNQGGKTPLLTTPENKGNLVPGDSATPPSLSPSPDSSDQSAPVKPAKPKKSIQNQEEESEPEEDPDNPEKTFRFASYLAEEGEGGGSSSVTNRADSASSGTAGGNHGKSSDLSSANQNDKAAVHDSNSSGQSSTSFVNKTMGSQDAKMENAILLQPEKPRWEMIFGWRNTLEENLKLSRNIEEYFGWPESIETYLWRGTTPDIKRIRESIQYGGIGFFILMLSLTVQLILRAGWLAAEKRIHDALSASKVNGVVID